MPESMEKYDRLSDEELFQKFMDGDENGFDKLVKRYEGPLFTVAMRMVGQREKARDIFQETFMRVLKHKDNFDPDGKFSTWIYAIAANLCRDHLRSRARSPIQGGGTFLEPVSNSTPERESYLAEVRRAVDEAISGLPPDQREVFVMREYGGMSFKEIAEATGQKLNTVLGRMHLAVKKMRVSLEALAGEEA